MVGKAITATQQNYPFNDTVQLAWHNLLRCKVWHESHISSPFQGDSITNRVYDNVTLQSHDLEIQ